MCSGTDRTAKREHCLSTLTLPCFCSPCRYTLSNLLLLPFSLALMEDEGINASGNNAAPMNLPPVAPEQSGQGLPYAPENFPNPGDVWSWRTGLRVAVTGFFKDRYLYPPANICRAVNSGSSRRRITFASKLAVQRFVKESFPDANVQDFFASFSWKIPAICPG